MIFKNAPFCAAAIVTLCVCMVGLVFLSPAFDYEAPLSSRPTHISISLMVIAGIAWLIIVSALKTFTHSKKIFGFLVLLGFLLKLSFLPSTPIDEDDFYRYFWGGALVANGINPYIYAPADALTPQNNFDFDLSTIPGASSTPRYDTDLLNAVSELAFLKDEPYLMRAAYPYIRSIYPPVAQAFFALSYSLSPWDISVFRVLLLFMDLLSLFLIIKLLNQYEKPRIYALIYWLNPIMITETINAAHMDVLLLPFVLGAALLVCQGKYGWAGTLLAGAVGVKFWPVILAPALFWSLRTKPFQLIKKAAPFAALSTMFALPQLKTRFDDNAGLNVYAQDWDVNSFLFGFVSKIGEWITDRADLFNGDADLTSRAIVLVLLTTIIPYSLKWVKTSPDGSSVILPWLIVTASLFLLSPTGYPWYMIWFLPWLVFYPHPALLFLTATLPLYDLRFLLTTEEAAVLFNDVVVTIQFLPTFLLFLFSYYQYNQKKNHFYA